MVESIQKQINVINNQIHRKLRRNLTQEELNEILPKIRDKNLSYTRRATNALKLFLQYETPIVLEDTLIQGLRTLISFPEIYNDGELNEIKKTHYVHEKGKVTNVAWDVATVLKEGLEGRRKRLLNGNKRDAEFVICVQETIDAVINYADRLGEELIKAGKINHGKMVSKIIRYGAETTLEALQLFRLLHFTLWGTSCYHNTVGRFDQWLYPYYLKDKYNGVTDDEILVYIEDFFLSFNRDSDLYYSLAWGDNGQSLVLGGVLKDGSCAVNELTYLSLTASKEIRQIDPKINLRVDKNTPIKLFEYATELTKIGLGFPQYSNDDVVIPCLLYWGYDLLDARDYCIAACWEFIIPNVALDIPNIAGTPIATIVNNVILNNLNNCNDTKTLLNYVYKELEKSVTTTANSLKNIYIEPAPFVSILMENCLERGYDVSLGMKYNNYGFHGVGLSCATDQISAIDSLIFKKQLFTKERLLNALKTNFEGDSELKYALRNEADKMGRDDNANEIGNTLLGLFADSLKNLKNERGGIYRAGTGSAMYYLWQSETLPATADGREAFDYLPTNFSPSLFITKTGPLSVVKGFSPENLKRTSNGGPLTLELHDTVFKTDDSIKKVAKLVQAYVISGGHQLQLNAVNGKDMLDAQIHPEKHRDLIVRVWGWSGHFIELDKKFQNQIIKRVEFNEI